MKLGLYGCTVQNLTAKGGNKERCWGGAYGFSVQYSVISVEVEVMMEESVYY